MFQLEPLLLVYFQHCSSRKSPLVILCTVTHSIIRLVGRWLTTVPVKSARAFRHLSSLVEERRQLTAEYGADHPDKPNDFLTWSLESEPGSRASVNEITHRILSVNFAAVHTTANVRVPLVITCSLILIDIAFLDVCSCPIYACCKPSISCPPSGGG